jgi:hypothetical protein
LLFRGVDGYWVVVVTEWCARALLLLAEVERVFVV